MSSSLPGAAITSVKINGIEHEFSSIKGIKEDVVMMMLNIKRLRVKMLTSEPQIMTLKAKGVKTSTAEDIEIPGQIEIINPELGHRHSDRQRFGTGYGDDSGERFGLRHS